jgi:hypothetical protein
VGIPVTTSRDFGKSVKAEEERATVMEKRGEEEEEEERARYLVAPKVPR